MQNYKKYILGCKTKSWLSMRIEIGMKLSGKWEWKVSVIIGIV